VNDYDYGNTRLHAREAGLLRGEQYLDLLGRDVAGLWAALAATDYRPQIQAATAAAGGTLEALHQLARDHLVAALAGIGEFYSGRSHDVVSALLGRFDVHGILTVLRARHHGLAPDAACRTLLPVGRLDLATAQAAARKPDLPAAAQFLAERGVTDPATATALRAARRRYDVDSDLSRVEATVARSAHAHQLEVLIRAGADADPALDALRREADDRNLLLALRLRETPGGRPGGDRAETYLPGGTIAMSSLAAIQQAPTRTDALGAIPTRAAWQGPLRTWRDGDDLAALHAELDTQRLRTDLRLLRRAGRQSAGGVLRHVLAHQAQARNLRLVAQVATGLLGEDEARRQLVLPK
jgi:vacuolar-type H+-ATPase subunit C/Vma6